jgi:hypothetical protein
VVKFLLAPILNSLILQQLSFKTKERLKAIVAMVYPASQTLALIAK